jgi:hypothetical protein
MNEERLVELLAVYRFRGSMPDFRSVGAGPFAGTGRLESRPLHRIAWLSAAAAILIVVLAIALRPHPNEWRATSIFGDAQIPRVLRAGDLVKTDAASRVRLEAGAIGTIDVAEKTTLRLIESRRGRQRLALSMGKIHAKTISPPGVFVIDTPSARAIDLGCEFDLTVFPEGDGELRVSAGWVQLEHGGQQTLVPQGAVAVTAPDGRLSAPVFTAYSKKFTESVIGYSFGRKEDLPTILSLARRRDALTLLNLFRFATPEERLRIYDRLSALVPAPPTIPREAMQNWTLSTNDNWWPSILKASGVNAIKKKKGMLRGL